MKDLASLVRHCWHVKTLKVGGLCGEGVTGWHRCRRFTFHLITPRARYKCQCCNGARLCVCVCVFLSVEQCLLLELFSNGVGFMGWPDATLCKSDCGCNGGVSKGLLFLLYCCLLCQLNAGGSHCIPDIYIYSSGFSLYSGHHRVSFRLWVRWGVGSGSDNKTKKTDQSNFPDSVTLQYSSAFDWSVWIFVFLW